MYRILLFLLLLCTNLLRAQDAVVVKGIAPDYAGMTLVIECYENLLTKTIVSLGTLEVNKSGQFKTVLKVDNTTLAFLNLGQFRAHIYLEPQHEYEIVLPPFHPIHDSERFNPFFQPEEIQLGILNQPTPNLNSSLQYFENFYEVTYNSHAVNLVRKNNTVLADKIIALADSLSNLFEHPYFQTHALYRKAILYSLPRARQTQAITSRYFANHPVEFNSPAYFDALEKIYTGFLPAYLKSPKGKLLAKTIESTNRFDSICMAFQKDTLYSNPALAELILLKSLSDNYYQGSIKKSKIVQIIKGAIEQATTQQNCTIAESIYKKITYLQPGSPAPIFELSNLKGKTFTLDKKRDKFTYLAFMHTENFACQKDWPALLAIQEQFKRELQVVVVFVNEDPEEITRFVSGQKLNFTVLTFHDQQKIVFDYRIKAMPSYFLIDPTGILDLSPAPKPNESLEGTLQKVLQNYHRQQLRKEPQKARSIMDMQ